jgi:hypothetical protein
MRGSQLNAGHGNTGEGRELDLLTRPARRRTYQPGGLDNEVLKMRINPTGRSWAMANFLPRGTDTPSARQSSIINRRSKGRARRKREIDFRGIAKAALPRLPEILSQLLPGGVRRGREYVVRNPRRTDRSPGSFSINLSTGKWADFAGDARGGDAISLIAYVKAESMGDAARRLARLLGREVYVRD